MNPNSIKKSLVLAPLHFQMLKSLSYRFDAAAYFSIITFELKLKKYLFLSFFFFNPIYKSILLQMNFNTYKQSIQSLRF